MDLALLLLRLVVGLYLFEHGAEKLFGWFGGPGIKKFATLRPPIIELGSFRPPTSRLRSGIGVGVC